MWMERKIVTDEKFKAKSPLGYTVVCLDRQWRYISQGHSIMQKNKEAIIEAIEEPEYIYKDKERPEKREIYYGNSSTATYRDSGLYTKVVINMPDEYNSEGEVVTAWPTRKIKEGGEDKKYDKRSTGQEK